MKLAQSYRPLPLALTALIALVSALAALALTGGRDASAHPSQYADPMHAGNTAGTFTTKQVVFQNEMRKLWEDHITWTRLAVISLTTDSPDTQATVGRLLKNQADIGNAIAPYYGKSAGKALTGLLREHILIAADIIAAAKAGDSAKLSEAQADWVANADEIATFLSKANPRSWKLPAAKAMMREHLRLTTDEVVARLQSRWAADVVAYDRIHRQALEMADMLAIGIERQFPARFR
jgi:hypothetical protein